ncbi:chemotaxis protein CheW [Fluviispira sanaruensis]|uniref:Chemotaxis protein CheW n=1 Tax=Fluviispira sanaruensis TaxID=2493639 RepID=A0A4P2VLJ5_FLUSA|nr:chemotaxis protein CheW [Fluviispira sanaruensis]BBH52844.1 chemotaxis protein CheW [Fluviispira sanaruensis]
MEQNYEIEENKYLIFKLLNEDYACNLLQIKEVIKSINIKPVPFMVPYFKGIINLRGKILSIIDFRIKVSPIFNDDENKGIILVVESKDLSLGVIVDDLISVQTINKEEIQQNKEMKYTIDNKFIIGNYILKESLVTVIDLASSISEEELKAIKDNENLNISFNL